VESLAGVADPLELLVSSNLPLKDFLYYQILHQKTEFQPLFSRTTLIGIQENLKKKVNTNQIHL
jgi:hypothetical protein